MDNRRDKDKEFDRAQAMDRLTQDDKDKISLIKMMMDKEKKSMKEKKFIDYSLDPYDDKEEVEGMIIKFVVAKRGVDEDIAKSFIDTHYNDIINANSTDDILDEFDEFMSVNTEYVKEENFISPNEEGDEAVGRESASGAFEEVMNWRGETLKEQFKRLSR
jgi:hypothetical protein|tara:strand:- start:794 stop:1276 length:483 start_codon:yes stop_codon:yes gene_type:complete